MASGTSPTRRKTGRAQPRAERPHIPGYGLPEGTKGLLPWSWAERRLTRSFTYWLTTVRPDGAPHTMPVWGVWHEGAFWFSTGAKSVKARNLRRNARCVVCTDRAEAAVVVEGTARVVPRAHAMTPLSRAYATKYKPWKLDPKLGPVYRVTPRVAFGLSEKQFMRATRWRF